MRFDSAAHVESWKATGKYPAIHTALADFVCKRIGERPARILDLCCNQGLLGEQLGRRLPAAFLMGVDASLAAIARAREAGVSMLIERLYIDAATYDELGELLSRHRIDTVVARRCLPEILGSAPNTADAFAKTLCDAGVQFVFLQGRVVVPRPSNPFFSVDREVEALSGYYAARSREGQLAELGPR